MNKNIKFKKHNNKCVSNNTKCVSKIFEDVTSA